MDGDEEPDDCEEFVVVAIGDEDEHVDDADEDNEEDKDEQDIEEEPSVPVN